jgi:hypothetical protein
LRLRSLYSFGNKDELFSKIYFQVDTEEELWRLAEDIPHGNYVCELNTGSISYARDSYRTFSEDPLEQIFWTEIPADAQEILDIKFRLFPLGGRVEAAYKASNFEGNEYGIIHSAQNFTYANSGDLRIVYEFEIFSQDESTACYCREPCSAPEPEILCFNIVGIVEGYHRVYKKVFIGSQELGLNLEWPY